MVTHICNHCFMKLKILVGKQTIPEEKDSDKILRKIDDLFRN